MNPLDAKEGQDTNMLTISNTGGSNAGESEPESVPMQCSKSCSRSCTIWWLGWPIDNHKRCGFIEWVLCPVILEAVLISAGSFSNQGMVKSMVCTPIYNPSPVYYHYMLKLMFIPCTTKLSEKETAKIFFDNIVCHVGLPLQIISDRDTRWRNDFWKEVCEYMGSKRALTTAYHPQADGQTEVLNQTLEVALRAYINFDRNNWSELLPKIAFAYNNTPHTATGYAPAHLLYGFKPNEPISYILDSNNQNISRPSLEDMMKPESKEFIEEFDGMRIAAKDALRRAQAIFESNYNNSH